MRESSFEVAFVALKAEQDFLAMHVCAEAAYALGKPLVVTGEPKHG